MNETPTFVIDARSPNDALFQAVNLLSRHGQKIESRNGDTIEYPGLVVTSWRRPWNRVLVNDARRGNPFLHFFESLWMLAGRDDVAFLEYFNPRMKEYSDDGKTLYGAYGPRLMDSANRAIKALAADPNSRREHVAIWRNEDSLVQSKDKPCNVSVTFRVRDHKLYTTVMNRSNDVIWGAYGTNMVQFSFLHEYVARSLGVQMGRLHQVHNSFHVYTSGPGGKIWDRLQTWWMKNDPYDTYKMDDPLVVSPPLALWGIDDHEGITRADCFRLDLARFFDAWDETGDCAGVAYSEDYFIDVVIPMFVAWEQYKSREFVSVEDISCPHWQRGAERFLQQRGITVL